jgi:hypothetical protein
VAVDIVATSLSDTTASSPVTFTFSEATTNFTAGDVTVTNGSLSGFTGSGTSYSATFTATDGVSGTGAVSVTAGSYTNAALTPGAGGSDMVTIDRVNPTVTVDIVEVADPVNGTSTVNFFFSEVTTNFIAGDVTVTNGTLTGFTGSGQTYTAVYVNDGNPGLNTVSVNAGSYTDPVGNTGATGSDAILIGS